MQRTLQIRVHYPLQSGQIVLRTDADWSADIEAVEVSADGAEHRFEVHTEQPYVYLKPCIRDGGLRWSVGANYLAERDRSLFPHFFSGTQGEITPPLTVPCVAGGAYRVRVYQPPGYRENTLKRYPLLVMHDGSNLFFPAESFMGAAWEVDDTFDLLDAMSLVDKAVVVGVEPCDRMYDYTKPGYEAYGRFIVDDLLPAVRRNFRTQPGAASTTIMGSSLGGVVSFYLAWQHPEVFGNVAALSSTFGYRDDLLERVASEPKRDLRIYLDSGWPRDNYEVTRTMRTLLIRKGYRWGEDLMYLAFPLARHSESAWAARCHIPFQFFYGRPQLG